MKYKIYEVEEIVSKLSKRRGLLKKEKEALIASLAALKVIEVLLRNPIEFRNYEKEEVREPFLEKNEIPSIIMPTQRTAIANIERESSAIIFENLFDFYLD